MGANSKIEWTHHTFNPWRGCTKVSPGCQHCYAESLSKRNTSVLGEWGPNGKRVIAAEAYWQQPMKWDREAAAAGERRLVFCASLADVFEDRPELVKPRADLFALIDQTPNLDWLLLTKRPENIERMWLPYVSFDGGSQRRGNVWLGVSIERFEYLSRAFRLAGRRPLCSKLFWSVEPMLGPLPFPKDFLNRVVDWVIVGGESGHGARPMHPNWVRRLRDDCNQAGVSFFFKQWGEWAPWTPGDLHGVCGSPDCATNHVWPNGPISLKVGKKAAGRMLDGRTWDEIPARQTRA